MEQNFKKVFYNNRPGYSLTHTCGHSAGGSTLNHPHFCPDYMLFYFIHGTGNIKIEGKHYEFHPGDLIITNPSELFHCTIDPNVYHERIVLHISDSFLSNFPYDPKPLFRIFQDRSKGIGNQIPANIVKSNQLDFLFTQILQLLQNNTPETDIEAICKIGILLSTLNRFTKHPPVPNTAMQQSDPIIEQVLDYLNAHFTEQISIATVADVFNINESYLSHLFKEHTGMSLWNYVILRRLHKFNSQIKNDLSVEEACYRVGFQNYSNFFRLYKKYMGISPLAYKKQKE